MLNEPTITLHGNVVAAPELRFFDSGTPVAEFTVAQNPRFRRGDEWVDGEPVFLTVKVWREQAENVAESLLRGHRVTVTGRLRRRAWQDKESGEKRTRDEIEADDVAVSLQRQRVRVQKVASERRADETGQPVTG
jgi:single-strand DNA-binding protein